MEQWLNIIHFHRKIRQLCKKVSPGIFLGYELVTGRLWKGDILKADLEDLEKLDASECNPRRINAKEVLIRKKDDEFRFPVADGTAKMSKRDHEFREPHPKAGTDVRSEDLSGEIQGESGESQPAEPKDDAEAHADLWSIQGDFIYSHHNELRVQLCVPKEETFPFPQKFLDVTRSTHTDQDVLQEKRMDDYLNVDSNRHLSDSWRGFAKFALLKKNSPKDICGSGETDKDPNNYQTSSCMARSLDEHW